MAAAGELIGFEDPPNINDLGRIGPLQRLTWFVPNWFRVDVGEMAKDYAGNYVAFAQNLEDGPHNIGHGWIGGIMTTMFSPGDPAFWFHHAQVDRIWWMWQKKNSNLTELSSSREELDPWDGEFSVADLENPADLGDDAYEYV